jgi:hypothetical protein
MSAASSSDGPIFIVGVARSGTTLLRYMLCSHPRIYIPPESNFIPRFFRDRPGQTLTRDQALKIVQTVKQYGTFWRDWRGEPLEPRKLVDELDRPITPSSLIGAIYARYAQQYGASRWGDKSTIYAGWIDLFVAMFPTAKIVHIIRDPRDVAVSSVDAYRGARFFYMDPYYAARMWRSRISKGIAVGRSLPPEQYHEIRYEDLTAEPERRLRELCDFLGEPFDAAMLEPGSEAQKHYHKFGIHERVRGGITTARTGRWHEDLSPADQRLVQKIAGDLMQEFGYQKEDLGRQGLRERLRGAALRSKFEAANLARAVLRALGVFNPSRLLLRLPRRRPETSNDGRTARSRAATGGHHPDVTGDRDERESGR